MTAYKHQSPGPRDAALAADAALSPDRIGEWYQGGPYCNNEFEKRTCGGYAEIDANDPTATSGRLNETARVLHALIQSAPGLYYRLAFIKVRARPDPDN